MQVWIKSLKVEMQVKQNGIELEIRSKDGAEQLGDCYATMTGLIWCRGRKKKENGIKIKWEDFITICSSEERLKAAIKAAKLVKDVQD
ncbi:hypothetical protein FNU76_22105 [Chitinimonas arctica]|uniref:Uncharacterized protein n=1 Tax=Chitinimonas arctica TaxID=2594795 RepID=A0A516SKZ6_9NEIS|nr:hypothetical protein [Chitinimonas arctica]QDQ28826.1 hypothetical protein FNU76_22105 [Chitinimonas arctica]